MDEKKMNPNYSAKTKKQDSDFSTFVYNGQPIPVWLHIPAYDMQQEEKRFEIPEWLKQPVNF